MSGSREYNAELARNMLKHKILEATNVDLQNSHELFKSINALKN